LKHVKHIFFDLDHTLWDYDTNANRTLEDLYQQFELSKYITKDSKDFVQTFFKTNDQLWAQYNVGEIDRDTIRLSRFEKVLEACGCKVSLDHLAMNDYFLHYCPRQKEIIDGADVALEYLSKKYPMSIITNGFDDVQFVKLEACGLGKYFQHVITSESTGHKKPSKEIFDHALEKIGMSKDECAMIGDNPSTDIKGAQNAGITPVFFNPTGQLKATCEYEISHLSELLRIF